MKSAAILVILSASLGLALSAPSKGHAGEHHTGMPMHMTETPHMMGSNSTSDSPEPHPEPQPEPEAKPKDPKEAAAKQINEKSDTMVSMAPHKEGEMMASTISSNMMNPGHGSTEASMKHSVGQQAGDHKSKSANPNHPHDHDKSKKH